MAEKVRKPKRILVIILSAVILSCGIGAGLWIWLNDRTGPDVSLNSDNTYIQIDEKYTDRKITDGDSAIASLIDVADILGLRNALEEFIVQTETVFNGNTYYRLAQVYEGIPVYGRDIVVIANENNDAEGLNSCYMPVVIKPAEPKLSAEDAEASAKKYIGEMIDSNDLLLSVHESELMIYEETLVWRINIFGYTGENEFFDYNLFIDAENGSLAYQHDRINYAMKSTEVKGQKEPHEILVDYNDYLPDTYLMQNFDRSGEGAVLSRKAWVIVNTVKKGYEKNWVNNFNQALSVVSWKDGENPNESAVDAYVNLTGTLQFYQSVLHRNSWDGEGANLFVVVGVPYKIISINDNEIKYNTFSQVFADAFSLGDEIIGFTSSVGAELSAYANVVAHEFTHKVVNMTAGLKANGTDEASALNEAYCDIFGIFAEYYISGSTEWIVNAMPPRNMKEPNKWHIADGFSFSGHPDHYSEYDKNGNSQNNEGSCHYNSTIISHAAYLMWNGGENTGDWTRINDTEKLAKIWYGSLLIMHSNASFSQCRNAVELSARIMIKRGELTQAEYNTVVKAFDAVGINNATYQFSQTVKNIFDLIVYNFDGAPFNYYNLKIEEYVEDEKWPIVGSFITRSEQMIHDSIFRVKLSDGRYKLTVSDFGPDKGTPVTIKITVMNSSEKATDKVEIYTDSCRNLTIILNPSEGNNKQPEQTAVLNKDFEGIWQNAYGSTITISDLQTDSFDFSAALVYGESYAPNMGYLEGYAVLIDENTAQMIYADERPGESKIIMIKFKLSNEKLIVETDVPSNQDEWAWFGWGYNVSISGEYIKDNGQNQNELPGPAGAKIELSEYMEWDIYWFVDIIGDMHDDYSSSGIQYSNDSITVCSYEEYPLIAYISIDSECDYTICGISYGDDLQNAISSLTDKGWKVDRKIGMLTGLVDDKGYSISLYSLSGTTISSVSYFAH